MNELLTVAQDCVQKYLAIAKDKLGVELPPPHLSLNMKGHTAGRAHWTSNSIVLNGILFNENKDKFLARTIPHEVAHLVAYKKYSTPYRSPKPHGQEWKHVMRVFGCEESRCHSYDTTNSAQQVRQRYELKCKGCGKTYQITSILVNRIRNANRKYSCNLCRTPIDSSCIVI